MEKKPTEITEPGYEMVIGLEVHIELATATKIFCGCSTKFGAMPNTQTCPVCTGMPGSLPVLNKKAVEYAIALGLATGSRLNRRCFFDRKNYFYPDNPQNYQISQRYVPICRDGCLELSVTDRFRDEKDTEGYGRKCIRIHEMHLEEDAGKLTHDEETGVSLVDYNRSGVPLIEIVSEPDFRNEGEVIAYLEKLRMLCRYLGISDCRLQEGSMRVDVNLSVRKAGKKMLGTRTEMKNLNSFKAITRAIAAESKRQTEVLNAGGQVIQETRRWDDAAGCSYPMRSKEDSKDYRYFPDPDVPPVLISEEWIKKVKECQPEFQEERAARFQTEYGIPRYDAELLTQSKRLAELFEETAGCSGKPKKTANWFMGELLGSLKEKNKDPETLSFTPKHMADLILAVEEGKINRENAREVFTRVVWENVEPLSYIETHGLRSLSDVGALQAAIQEMITENAEIVAEYRAGKEKVFGFLVGQVMKKTKGKADPATVNKLLRKSL